MNSFVKLNFIESIIITQYCERKKSLALRALRAYVYKKSPFEGSQDENVQQKEFTGNHLVKPWNWTKKIAGTAL